MDKKRTINLWVLIIMLFMVTSSFCSLSAQKGKLYTGWAASDITPPAPVALTGQMHRRISKAVQDPITVTVLSIETVDDKGVKEQAIMVSCDLLWIRRETQEKLRNLIKNKIPDFNSKKLFLHATHTHTAPGLVDGEFYGLYDTSDNKEVMLPSEYEEFFIKRCAEAIERSWNSRSHAGFSWGLGNAVLSHNRRTVKCDGTARMYGVTDHDFSHYEGVQDNRVKMLFFWDMDRKLTGIIVNTVATAQVTDGTNYISADFYHETRKKIRERYGDDIFILFQVGAAGDITPVNHENVYREAESIMLKRKNITARQELANRLTRSIDEVIPYVKEDIEFNTIFKHSVVDINLPVKYPPSPPFYTVDGVDPARIHILRLGEIAIATNPFELFTDYGIKIQSRSNALLTFIVQLACHHSGYLPTERASKGGGYSAEKYLVGPEGGNMLVNETIRHINILWE